MEKEYHKAHGLTMAHLGFSLEELLGQPVELFGTDGMILTNLTLRCTVFGRVDLSQND